MHPVPRKFGEMDPGMWIMRWRVTDAVWFEIRSCLTMSVV